MTQYNNSSSSASSYPLTMNKSASNDPLMAKREFSVNQNEDSDSPKKSKMYLNKYLLAKINYVELDNTMALNKNT